MKAVLMTLDQIFDLVSFNFSPNLRYVYIVLSSLISAVIFLLLFKKTSNQKKIRYHKQQIWGHILQMRIYQDKFTLLVSSVFNILKHNLCYLAQMLIPLVVIVIPLLVFTVQINNRCGYSPLKTGQQFIIRVGLDQHATKSFSDLLNTIACNPPPGITLETPPLRIERDGNVFWRARVTGPAVGSSPSIRIGTPGHESLTEKVIVTDYHQKRFSPAKRKWSFWNGLFTHTEGFLPAEAPFTVVAIDYQRAIYPLLFWKVDALLLYFCFTIIFAFAFKRFLRVDI
jgi:hypothetical protein